MKLFWILGLALALFSLCNCSNSGKKPAGQADGSDLVAKGKRLYIYCQACHAITEDATPRLGPHLADIMTRQVATIPGFAYSDSLLKRDFVWDVANMTEWIKQPAKFVPGTTMVYAGMKDQEDLDALMAYLKTL